MKKIALHWQIIIGLVLGIVWAVLSVKFQKQTFTLDWIQPWGSVFIKLLKMIAIPLVLFSIIKGIADLSDIKKLARVGFKTLGIYLFTTILAVSLGLLVVNTVNPGNVASKKDRLVNRMHYEKWALQTGTEPADGKWMIKDSTNKAYMLEAGAHSMVISEDLSKKMEAAGTSKGPLSMLNDIVPDNIFGTLASNGYMLQIIFFGIFFGIAILYIPPAKSASLITVIDATNEVFLKMVDMVMKASPFFVFCLMAGSITEMAGKDANNIAGLLNTLLWYSVTVAVGLAILLFVVYPAFILLFSEKWKHEPLHKRYSNFFKAMGPAQLLAFTTSSSAATLPVTIECVNDNLKINKDISSFVLPIGATVNMDGTSLYQAVAVVFLAQFHFIDLTIGQQLTIVLTATLASIGSAAVPSAGLIMLILVLNSVGLNPAWIAIILPVDRILDMCRTTVNVTGDAVVCSIVDKTE